MKQYIHSATMTYNVFPTPHLENPYFTLSGCDPFMLTLFELLLPKLRYTGDKKFKIHLDTIQETYVMAVLNLKIA